MNAVERFIQSKDCLASELGSSGKDLLDNVLSLHKEVVKLQVQSDEALGQSNYFRGLLRGFNCAIAGQFDKSSDTDREFLKQTYEFIKSELEGSE